MQKKFYITKKTNNNGTDVPDYDRFQRVEHLNELLSLGWQIKELKTEEPDVYFILEKDDIKQKG